MDRLWTPWRYNYITGTDTSSRRKGVPARLNHWPDGEDKNCVFCNMIAAADYAIANGMAVGEAAGAGVADHVHMHALPRWSGDANFMTVIAETRVLPEPLEITCKKMRRAMHDDATFFGPKSSNQQ